MGVFGGIIRIEIPRVLLYNLPPSGGDFFPISLGYIAASLNAHGIEAVVAEVDAVTRRTGQEVANFVIAYKPTQFYLMNWCPASCGDYQQASNE